MALLFMDGVNYYTDWTTKGWSSVGSSYCAVTVGGGRFGGNYHHTIGTYFGGSSYYTLNLGANYSTLVAGAAIRTNNATDYNSNSGYISKYLGFGDSGTIQCYVGPSLTGKLTLYQGSNVLGVGTHPLSNNVWYFIELKAPISASATVEVRLGGVTEISVSGVNTKTTANSYANQFWFGGFADAANVDASDIYICDTTGSAPLNDFLGDCRIETLFPTGVGTTTQWTPSTGANWQNVDESPADDDTTYNYAATPGYIDTYSMANLTAATGIVYAVQYHLRIRKDNAGTRTVAPVARIGSTNYLGAEVGLSTSYGYAAADLLTLSPATSSAWTISEVNDMEFGAKVVS